LYAITLRWREGQSALVEKLAAGNSIGKVEAVSLLGYRDRLNFQQTGEGLKVQLPDQAPGKIAFVLKIEGAIV